MLYNILNVEFNYFLKIEDTQVFLFKVGIYSYFYHHLICVDVTIVGKLPILLMYIIIVAKLYKVNENSVQNFKIRSKFVK